MLPCLIFEDDDLLVVNKPAGLNTHAPGPYSGEGLYDWLRHREPRWGELAIIHRLDKETSGVIVFSKTRTANRSLTAQFTQRAIQKAYWLVTDRSVPRENFTVKTALVRAGEKYVSRPPHRGGELAETTFCVLPSTNPPALALAGQLRGLLDSLGARLQIVEAEPMTGRTHQIRVHAAASGFPILGDTLYGGTPADRVYLHAAQLKLVHPTSGKEMVFSAPVDFNVDPRLSLRTALNPPELTNTYRMLNGASEGWPGWYVERLGDYLLSQSEQPLAPAQLLQLERLVNLASAQGAYHKRLTRQVQKTPATAASPQLVLRRAAPDRFNVHENGLNFELSFAEGYSVGVFLDQRDNRRRLLTRHIAADFPLPDPTGGAPLEVLNTFAYTCGFSVAAAKAGARTTSLDLSKKYLEWGKRNFALNELNAADHDFIFGDAFDWLRRLAKKGRSFDVVLLDPPTFSQSKDSGVFRVEKDYGRLVSTALRLLKAGGVLFASTNAANWPPAEFLDCLKQALRQAKRSAMRERYFPQPPDFPVSRAEPAYLKTVWLQVA